MTIYGYARVRKAVRRCFRLPRAPLSRGRGRVEIPSRPGWWGGSPLVHGAASAGYRLATRSSLEAPLQCGGRGVWKSHAGGHARAASATPSWTRRRMGT
jgi:hypothetical protein